MEPACDECKFRKYRCSKNRPSCSRCQRRGIPCIYSPRPCRTPLTREYVTSLENRLRALERLLSPSRADVSVEDTYISSSEHSVSHHGDHATGSTVDFSDPRQNDDGDAATASREALPETVDGFDWVEDNPEKLTSSNGMAALSLDIRSGGYFGSSSNAVILRALQSTGWNVQDNSPEDLTFGGHTISHSIGLLSELSSRQTETILINAYFQFYHTSYPIVHEPTFRAQYSELLPRPGGTGWKILLNAMLAIGAWSLGQDDSVLSNPFYLQAHHLVHSSPVFETGNLVLVQALTLLGNYVQKQNRPNTGWNFLGLATRIAISIALHKELPHWDVSVLTKEMRRRTWWCLYIFDSGASITYGRPLLLPNITTVDVKDVSNVHDADMTAATTECPPSADEPTLYSVLLAQTKFHRTVNAIFEQLISGHRVSAEKALAFDMTVQTWYASLPAYIRDSDQVTLGEVIMPAARRLTWRYYNFQMLLFRPFVVDWATRQTSPQAPLPCDSQEQQCRERCLEIAHMTIRSIEQRAANETPIGTWYAVYFLFQATLIPSIVLCVDPHSSASATMLEDVNIARQLLGTYPARTKAAEQFLTVINSLCDIMTAMEENNFDDISLQTSLLNSLYQQFIPSLQDIFDE